MELNKYIPILQRQIAFVESCRDQILSGGDYELSVLNVESQFLARVQLGQIEWRLGRSPVTLLQEALQGVLRHREVLMGIGVPQKVIVGLPLHFSIYLASLLNTPHPKLDIEDYDEPLAPWIFVGNVLMGADSIENWSLHQNKMPNKKVYALVRASFENYAGLLAGKVSPQDGVAKGEIYYKRRREDSYYNNSPLVFGSGEANDHFVDFQLAAVLKQIGSTVPSIHAWRW